MRHVLFRYQIEPLAQVLAVRTLILSSAPMDGDAVAPYRHYCQALVGSKIYLLLQQAGQLEAYIAATVQGCTFINGVPVHQLKILPERVDFL